MFTRFGERLGGGDGAAALEIVMHAIDADDAETEAGVEQEEGKEGEAAEKDGE
jgi:hypothetical protein